MGHKPTEEQDAIISAVAEPTSSSLMIEAYAGTGKSSTLEMAAPGVRVPALGVAFNKSTATTLKPRLPSNFEVKTFNGLGYGAWMRANPGVKRWELEDRKVGKLLSQVAKDREIDLSSEDWDSCRRLVSKAMQAGLTPGDIGTPLMKDTAENWLDLADELWIPEGEAEFMIDLAKEVLIEDIELARKGTICFDDQIYCSSCLGGSFPRYPFVMVDESQDLSPLNQYMLAHSMSPTARLISVGDRRQAIYAFRGADAKSMDSLRALRPQWKDRMLTLTFRCPKAVVERQQSHAPGYRAHHTNAEGLFKRQPHGTENLDGWTVRDLEDHLPAKPGAEMAVLCRNNAPLMSLAFKLIRSNVPVVVLGRDIGKNLTSLLKKICPNSAAPADVVVGLINDWEARERALAEANDKPEKVEGICDRSESLLACLDGSGARTCGELVECIKKLFERNEGKITLSTIHKAKGLEWDLVVHLDPWRIPSKFAKKAAAEGDNRQLIQEYNLLYVAETRTKHTLINANLKDYNG